MVSQNNIVNKRELPEIMQQFEVLMTILFALSYQLEHQQAALLKSTVRRSGTSDDQACAAVSHRVVLSYLRVSCAW
jgi:hypothetical protein